jgi:hypothetical protein
MLTCVGVGRVIDIHRVGEITLVGVANLILISIAGINHMRVGVFGMGSFSGTIRTIAQITWILSAFSPRGDCRQQVAAPAFLLTAFAADAWSCGNERENPSTVGFSTRLFATKCVSMKARVATISFYKYCA